MADNIPQLAWMTDAHGAIIWYNRRWYDYTGTTFEVMQSQGWQSLLSPEDQSRVLTGFQTQIGRGEPWEDTFPLRRHDGQMRWHLSRALPIKDEAGRVLRWFGTNTDITEQRKLAADLAEADDGRTSSWRRWRTSSAIRWRPSAPDCKCCDSPDRIETRSSRRAR